MPGVSDMGHGNYLGSFSLGVARCARCGHKRQQSVRECRCGARVWYDAESPDWGLLLCDLLILGTVALLAYSLARILLPFVWHFAWMW